MRVLSVALLVVTVSMTSCAVNQEKGVEENKLSAFQPKPLNDDWSKWFAGRWQGRAESDAGTAGCSIKVEYCLNGQFLIIKGESKIIKLASAQKQYLKEVLYASDEDIKKFQNSIFKGMEFRTIDPRTGEIIGYLFDSLRCVAEGRGKIEGNKEIMNWQWSAQGQGTSVRVIEKVGTDKLVITQKYTFPDGKTMLDKAEMSRKKIIR